jgi:hypothetical protein
MSEDPRIVKASDEHAVKAGFRAPAARTAEHAPRAEAPPHAHKFRVVMGALVGIAVAAVIIAVSIAIAGRSDTSSAKWSSWSPTDGGTTGAREIADHLAPLYRISGTDQLDIVTLVNVNNNAAAAAASGTSTGSSSGNGLAVAVRPNSSSSAVSLLNGNTVAFNFCGIGTTNCAIGVGTPTPDRLLLLRREALELALYTFKYISGTQNVVAILPPGHTVQGCSGICPNPHAKVANKPVQLALLFLRDELQPWLSEPITSTFPEQFPPTVPQLPAWKQTPEASLVAQITSRGLFTEHLVQAQDGSNLIVLDQQPPQ